MWCEWETRGGGGRAACLPPASGVGSILFSVIRFGDYFCESSRLDKTVFAPGGGGGGDARGGGGGMRC